MEFKNLSGFDVKSLERSLLEGSMPDNDPPWYLVTNLVGRLIISGYGLGLNPLTHLRKIFPSFTWKLHKVNPMSRSYSSKLRAVIAQADFIWPADDDTEECFVTARRKACRDKPWKLLGDAESPCEILEKEQVGMNTHPSRST